MKRPNVLLVYTDQQRWDSIRAAGFGHMITPNLDQLAAHGVLFEHSYCNNPVCMPSRHSLLSGKYPSVIGTTTNGIEMPPDAETVYSVLQGEGYHAAQLGKLHYLNHASRDHTLPHPQYGFDTLVVSDEPGCYEDSYIDWVRAKAPEEVDNCRCSTPPAWDGPKVVKQSRNTHEPYDFEGPEELTHSAFVADITCDFIRSRTGEEPWFAIAGFYAPHCPLNPPRRFVDMYDGVELPTPLMAEGENSLGLSDDEWRRVRAYYYGLVSHVDDQVGKIMAALHEGGMAEDTIVVFTSDHGEHLGDHGFVQKGPPGHDSCIRVPLIVSWPGHLHEGQLKDEMIEAVDVAPTILDLCGVEVPAGFQGRSFKPLLDGGGEYDPRKSIFNEFRITGGPSWKTVRTRAFKYCVGSTKAAESKAGWWSGGVDLTGGVELLFDLDSDPGELVNVAEDSARAADLSAMRRELVSRCFDADDLELNITGVY